MSKVSYPLKLAQTLYYSCPREEMSPQERACLKNDSKLKAVLSFRREIDSWSRAAQANDQGWSDAAPQSGVVKLSRLPMLRLHNGENVELSAKIVGVPDGEITSARLKLRGCSPQASATTKLSYKRSKDQEVYTEKVGGQEVKLILDHTRGVLTFDDPTGSRV